MLYLLWLASLLAISVVVLIIASVKLAKRADERSEIAFNTYREKNN